MVKLQDFARECGVTDRQVQRLLKKYEAELEGLYERKGPNGTWLTDEACQVLRSKMKQQPIVVGDGEADREFGKLKSKYEALLERYAAKSDEVEALLKWNADNAVAIAGAAQTQLLLEETRTERDDARNEAMEALVRADNEKQAREAAEAEAAELRQQLEQERADREAAWAEFDRLPFWKKARYKWSRKGE